MEILHIKYCKHNFGSIISIKRDFLHLFVIRKDFLTEHVTSYSNTVFRILRVP